MLKIIPHRKSFAATRAVSLVVLGHTNRNVSLSHKSQREIALVEALSRPIPDYQQGEVGEKKGPLFRKVCVFLTFPWALGKNTSTGFWGEGLCHLADFLG